MLSRVRGLPKNRSLVRIERLIAIAAVGLTAFGFTRPQVLSLAGLDFANAQVAGQRIDTRPTGSIFLIPQLQIGPQPADQIHGLAGTLKPLRGKL